MGVDDPVNSRDPARVLMQSKHDVSIKLGLAHFNAVKINDRPDFNS